MSCPLCTPGDVLYEDELWRVQPSSRPYPIAGWMHLVAKRHFGGPAEFDAREAATFGPMLGHLERVLQHVTGAARIYTAALGEAVPHFHCHMVPRMPSMPRDARGWSVFDLERAVRAGELPEPEEAMAKVIEDYRRALVSSPPPR